MARERSRSPSVCPTGTHTSTACPERAGRARRSASRRSVFRERSSGLVGMWPAAMGTTLRPSAESSLAGVKPVQPAPWTP